MAIQVGSVEVDVIPNTQGIYSRLRAGLVPAATRAGEDAGRAAGRSFGPAMQGQVGDIGLRIGEQIGQQIANRITAALRGAIRDGVTQGGRTARPAAVRQGDETGGAFSRALKTRLEAAFRSLPKINIDANTSEADADLQALRVRMETLANQRIGIDIDAEAAKAEIKLIEAELRRLGAEHPNVQVRADTAAARAQLAAVRAEIDAVDGKRARIDVDTSAAMSAVLHLAIAIAGLAAIPAVPVLAAGLGSIAAAGVAAGAGVGALAAVAVPAFVGIAGALQAQKAAQDAATASSLKGAQASSQGASKALQMAGAQQALATAERNGARQIAQAQQQVRQAKLAVADAVRNAAERNAAAARSIEDAERSLARSQKDARQAQQDLTAARREAAQQLEDLNARLAGAQLSQRDAVLGVREAQAELNRTMADAKATQLDKDRAQLAYDQAVQRLKEQTTETKRLRTETAAANKAGVDGSETVRNAQDRLAQAQEQVADRTRAVRDAQAEAARTQLETARQVAQAQERVGEATKNVAVAQQSAADAVASAQRQIASASLSAAGGVDQAAIAQGKYQEALSKLSPAARGTFNAFQSLRTAFKAWSTSLQPQVMPIFTRAINGLKNSLPGLTPFVLAAVRGITTLQDRISKGFKSPWWKSFKKDLAGSVEPAIVGLGVSFARIFKGMAGIIQAFLPHMDSISRIMQNLTGRFANWATNLKGSPEFERFLAYSAQMAPILASALRDMLSAVLKVAKALAPAATVLYLTLGTVARVIGSIAETLPWLIQLLYGVWIVTKLWTLAMAALNFVMSANPITLIIIGIVALVAAVIYAYKRFDWFRNLVQTVWKAIQEAASWAWQNVLRPVLTSIGASLQTVGRWALWLWKNVFAPVLTYIGEKAASLWAGYIKPNFDRFRIAMELLGEVAKWLWGKTIKPVFGWIGDRASWLWDKALKPAFNLMAQGIRRVSDAFETARAAIKLAWDKVATIAKAPVRFVIDTVYNRGIVGVWNKVATAFGANPLTPMAMPKGFARGGVLPGYTPGRDVHRFYSPTGGGLELSGGEAIMRPEFTRAVGPAFVGAMNRIARNRGATGVKAALAPALGGNPDTPTQRFADGGIFGWIGKTVAGVGSKAWNTVKEGASWLVDTVESSARAGLKAVVTPLLQNFPGADTSLGKMLLRIPSKILNTVLGYSKEADKRGAGGIGGPKVQRALSWARGEAGKPYIWGGVGPAGYDCSGFMSAIQNVLEGRSPHTRRWATGAFSGKTAPPGWVLNGKSPFTVGITNAGVGHTAGTLGRVNVESRGGEGVVVGPRARGSQSMLFTDVYGYRPGLFDSGGYLQPGLNLAYNGTGRPEPVFTTHQANALTSMAARGGGSQVARFEGDLRLDSGEFLGRVRGEAVQVVDATLRPAITAMRANRRG